MAYDHMEAYIDESGAFEAKEPFVAGIWFTAHGPMWRNIIKERRDFYRFGYSMHFNEISTKQEDWQFGLARRVFMDFRRVKSSWYSRMIHVSPESLNKWAELSNQDKYDNLLANLIIRFAPRAHTKSLTIIISDRPRPTADSFLPDGLENLLNCIGPKRSRPKFSVKIKRHRDDDLLQVADLLTSGIRQSYYPSKNKNKQLLAGLLQPLIGDRISVWNWE